MYIDYSQYLFPSKMYLLLFLHLTSLCTRASANLNNMKENWNKKSKGMMQVC